MYPHVIHIASEFAPLVKAGGLGDVIHGLSKEQQKMGMKVEVILPMYDSIDRSQVEKLHVRSEIVWSFEHNKEFHTTVWSGLIDGISIIFLEPHEEKKHFNQGRIYGCKNDIERFLYFSRAAVEYLHTSDIRPDVLHVHDWPTATAPLFLKELYKPHGYHIENITLTIHNVEHQGRCQPKHLTNIGIRGDDFRTEKLLQDPTHPTLINLLKAGILYSDNVVTVSPTYAKEIMTKEYGFGMESVLAKHKHKLYGILNGIELNYWNPEKDKFLFANYTPNPTYYRQVRHGKQLNLEGVSKQLGFTKRGPLFCTISRITEQKGPKLILHAIEQVLKHGGSFIFLGSSHDPKLEREFLELKNRYRNNPHIYIMLEFNEALSHQIFASADCILIPSIYEPCGLTQMIGMRYGTIPIARKTGGLSDSINDINDASVPLHERTGFLFNNTTTQELDSAIDRLFDTYADPNQWSQLIKNVLTKNFSWHHSAKKYKTLYEKVTAK